MRLAVWRTGNTYECADDIGRAYDTGESEHDYEQQPAIQFHEQHLLSEP